MKPDHYTVLYIYIYVYVAARVEKETLSYTCISFKYINKKKILTMYFFCFQMCRLDISVQYTNRNSTPVLGTTVQHSEEGNNSLDLCRNLYKKTVAWRYMYILSMTLL